MNTDEYKVVAFETTNDEPLTVGDMKKFLSDLPDEMTFHLFGEDDNNAVYVIPTRIERDPGLDHVMIRGVIDDLETKEFD